MSNNIKFCSKFAVCKNFHLLFGRQITSTDKFIQADLTPLILFRKLLKRRQIDGLIFHTVDVLETKLWKTTLQRHLTSFKANFLAITRTLLCTFMTAGRGSSLSRTGATANALAVSRRAGSRR